MKRITIAILLFSSFITFSQTDNKQDLQKEVNLLENKFSSLQSENGKRKNEIILLRKILKNDSIKLESLQQQTVTNSNEITKASTDLGSKITQTGKTSEDKISAVDQSLSKNSLYGIIGVLIAILLSGLLYLLLSKRQKSDRSDLLEQLSKTKTSIEESLIKEFGKQTELMNAQLHLFEQQKTVLQSTSNLEPDHSLALKVADQIVAIERSLGLMDEKTKGLQRIKNSITNLKDNLSANGYDMPDLIHKPFNQGMKIIVASSIPDENLKKGEEVISKIIKPQVNYNDKMIQAAQVEVSVGY